ncbi:MAG TPA: trehalose-phosphatase [Actinomycetota bacterium]|nr:trehalose-phosphatase [Actinomycetota bacterium]
MSLADLRERLSAAAILLDFDGTLSPIVDRPQDAAPAPGAAEVLTGLASRAGSVTIVTGRPSAFVRAALPVPGVDVVGLYGLEGHPPLDDAVRGEVVAAVAGEAGIHLEDKAASVAVHLRTAPDPRAVGERIGPRLVAIAERHGLELLHGKLVLELAPAGGGKGGVVRAILSERDPAAALYAGDDLADLSAFAALEDLARRGVPAVRVAVLGAETPEDLVAVADAMVEGPVGLLALLAGL